MKITRDAVWHTTKDYSIITLGLIFYAVGFCGFILPHGVITGGLAGIAALIFFKTGIPVAYSFYTLNIILLSIAYRIVGRGFVLKTIYGASGLSLFMLIAQMFFKSHPVYLEHDILLSVHPQRQHRRHRHRGCDGVEIPSDFRRAYDSLC